MVYVSEEDSRRADGFELCEPGEYNVFVDQVEVRDDVKYALTFREVGTSRYITRDWLTFRDKAMGIAKRKCIILGVITPGIGAFELNPESFKGKRCRLNIIHEISPKDGKEYARPGGENDAYFFGYAVINEMAKATDEGGLPGAGTTPF